MLIRLTCALFLPLATTCGCTLYSQQALASKSAYARVLLGTSAVCSFCSLPQAFACTSSCGCLWQAHELPAATDIVYPTAC